MRAQAKNVVIRVFRTAVGGAADRTRQVLGPDRIVAGSHTLVNPISPVTSVKEFFVMRGYLESEVRKRG